MDVFEDDVPELVTLRESVLLACPPHEGQSIEGLFIAAFFVDDDAPEDEEVTAHVEYLTWPASMAKSMMMSLVLELGAKLGGKIERGEREGGEDDEVEGA